MAQKGGHFASPKEREAFIAANLGLVHLLCGRLKGKGIEYEDLYQAGCMGLIKAADAFDPARGLQFSTYGVPVILGEMKRLFRDGGSVKVSRGLKELGLKINKQREKLTAKLGEEPTLSQLAESMGLTVEQVAEAVAAGARPVSLSAPEEGGQLDLPVASCEAEVTWRISLQQGMEKLAPADRELIYLRYEKGLTQSKVAKALGMTQVQVSRREKKLLLFLRGEFACN